MRRHPVEDDPEACPVKPIDECPQVVGRAEEGRRREESRYLIAPRPAERVVHDGEKLDVREAEVRRVVGELVGELEVRERAIALDGVPSPRPEVDLVDRERPRMRLRRSPPREPLSIAPLVPGHRGDRRRLRRLLRAERERIRLQVERAILPANLVLVEASLGKLRHEELPDARGSERAHRVQAPVPEVEVADNGDRPRRGRPDGEGRPVDAVDDTNVGAEAPVELLVSSLRGEMDVEGAERGREDVRVAGRGRGSVGV
jgi:hypothetical protein